MKKTLSDRSFSLVFVILLFFTGCNQDILQERPPEAIKGVLDLTDWDLEKEGPVALNGEWEFYWEPAVGSLCK